MENLIIPLLIVLSVLLLIAISLLLVLVFRKSNDNSSKIISDIYDNTRITNNLSARMTDMRQYFGDEMGRNRKETADGCDFDGDCAHD